LIFYDKTDFFLKSISIASTLIINVNHTLKKHLAKNIEIIIYKRSIYHTQLSINSII